MYFRQSFVDFTNVLLRVLAGKNADERESTSQVSSNLLDTTDNKDDDAYSNEKQEFEESSDVNPQSSPYSRISSETTIILSDEIDSVFNYEAKTIQKEGMNITGASEAISLLLVDEGSDESQNLGEYVLRHYLHHDCR